MLISIIIPVYNSEEYIERCLNSVIAQSYKNWECIIVDDGSTDKSFDILESWSKRDFRFKVLHQANAGAGMARNAGIEQAKGEYLVFVDSDDMIASDYLERLSHHNEDIVFIDIDAISENGKILRKEYLSAYKDKPIDDIIRYQMTGTMPWGGWRKAVKRIILNNSFIRYSNQKNGEEAVYSFLLLTNAKTVAFIDKPMYRYILRDNSLSNSRNEDPWGGLVEIYRSNASFNSILSKGYLNTLNALNLCATAISLDRLASYYSFKEYCRKARLRIDKCKRSMVPDVGIDYDHLDFKSRLACKFIDNEFYMGFYIISKLKLLIRKWTK